MDVERLVAGLSKLPDLRLTTALNSVHIRMPAISETLVVHAPDVLKIRPIFGPEGDPAIQLQLARPDAPPEIAILTGTDIVFAPARSEMLLDSAIPTTIDNAPRLVAYSEMERDAEHIALHSPEITDLAGLAGSVLLLRCLIRGAMNLGLRPIRSIAWWQMAWDSCGDDVPLPPFRRDDTWDALVDEGRTLGPQPHSVPVAVTPLPTSTDIDKSDFRELEPTLAAVQLDDEFVSSWKEWIDVHPRAISELLTKGIEGAHIDAAIYGEGSGTFELRTGIERAEPSLLHLRLSFPAQTMFIDEIRIAEATRGTGLFQRMIFNTEEVAAAMGLPQVRVLATGMGGYALAVVGRYPQPM